MLIKNSNSKLMAREAVVLDLGDLTSQADVIKREASAAAERIVRTAREERSRILSGAEEQGRRDGREAGLREGLEEGRAAGRAEALAAEAAALKAIQQRWTEALAAFEAERSDLLSEARSSLLQLAAALAERVTKRHVEADEHVLAAQLEAALRLVLAPTKLVIEVDPSERERTQKALPALMERLGGTDNAEVRPREGLGKGSVIVRTDRGEIDASIATQVSRAVAALMGEEPDADAASSASSASPLGAAPGAPPTTRGDA
ncbi:MAG: FliH/SctL family protein [Phycisphaerales bacterium]